MSAFGGKADIGAGPIWTPPPGAIPHPVERSIREIYMIPHSYEKRLARGQFSAANVCYRVQTGRRPEHSNQLRTQRYDAARVQGPDGIIAGLKVFYFHRVTGARQLEDPARVGR